MYKLALYQALERHHKRKSRLFEIKVLEKDVDKDLRPTMRKE